MRSHSTDCSEHCTAHSLRSELCSIDTRPSCAEDGNGLFPKQNCSQILIIVKFNKNTVVCSQKSCVKLEL